MNGSPVEPILDSAERAAASGDYALAESLLRQVARLQADSLGPHHPDLASTYNNLGVVCERANNLLDAGKFFRQAFSIASARLDAEDPLVITSRNNFNEFHRALGLVDTGASPDVDVVAPVGEHDRLQTSAEPAHDASIFLTAPASFPVRLAFVPGIATAVALLGALAIWWTRAPVAPETVDQRAWELGNPLQPVATRPSQGITPSTERAVSRTTAPAPAHGDARVIEGSLCESLSTASSRWECTPTSDPAAGGLLYFYTRIVSPTSSRVYHRWYQNGVLRQDVRLAVQANPSAGYRTYSRHRVDPGDWRVAVVDANGAVLREERIAVR